MKLYMKCTTDKYELPIAVADSPRELAKILGTTPNTVSSSINHGRRGWYKVLVEDKEPLGSSDWYPTNDGQLWRYRPDSTVEYMN